MAQMALFDSGLRAAHVCCSFAITLIDIARDVGSHLLDSWAEDVEMVYVSSTQTVPLAIPFGTRFRQIRLPVCGLGVL